MSAMDEGHRIVVLASGRGTNLQALIDAAERGDIKGRIVAVISDRKKAFALERAKKHGIDAVYIPPKGKTREEYDRILLKTLERYRPTLIVLAGYMRILTPIVVRAYRNRIMNIHPALLPSFGGKGYYGERVHRAVLEYGCKVSGCTVHFVDEEVDHGPIIVQRCVPVLEGDTPETLAERVLAEEHRALVEAVRLFCEGRLRVEGRIVRIVR
jgi:phosphoribosylglycinamide formyltransferase-1